MATIKSYKERLAEVDRKGSGSLVEQIVAIVERAIADGELAPGEKLPPTRELAALASVNHLTAVRAYRRAAELGLVSAQVGSGTFVRESAPNAARADASEPADADDASWQRHVLPPAAESESDRVLMEMYRHAQARGLIPLSVGYPAAALFPFEQFERATAAAAADRDDPALQYTDIAGLPRLRETLAEFTTSRGAPEGPDDLVITAGARQALSLTCRAIMRPGDTAVVESPTFMGILESLNSVGARVVDAPVDEQGLSIDALERTLAREPVRMVVLQPQLSNPSAADLSPERRARLLELARRHSFFVVEDGIYADIRFDGEAPGPLRPQGRGHVIAVDSLSKIVGGGLRVGWVAASGPVRDRIVAAKRDDDMHTSTLTQLALAEFLEAGDYGPQIERARGFYRERRDALCDAVEAELSDLLMPWTRPAGGGHLWLRTRGTVDERRLLSEAVRHGVTFVPGAAMTAVPPLTAAMRLSFGFLDPPELVEGVSRLARAFRSLERDREPEREPALPIA